VVFQPVTRTGRHREFDPLRRLTNSDVIELVAAQRPDWLRPADFVPVPCCFPTCRSITYLITDGENVVPIPRLLDVEDYLDYVANRVLPDVEIRAALERLWSASAFPGTQTSADRRCSADRFGRRCRYRRAARRGCLRRLMWSPQGGSMPGQTQCQRAAFGSGPGSPPVARTARRSR
jgi:hypothetical protein